MVDEVVVDNQYDPNQDPKQGETLPLDEVIRVAIDKQLYELHTWLPGQITAVKGNSLVDVQPQLQRKYANGDLVTLPIIQNVPVEHPRGANWSIKLPIAVGDLGRIVFAERSIDKWKAGGGIVDPQDPRKHHYSDAAFVPGLYPNNQQLTGAPGDMILTNGKAQAVLQAAGKFKFTNGTNEDLDLQVQLVQAILDMTINTIFGPMGPNNIATFTALKAKLTTLKGS